MPKVEENIEKQKNNKENNSNEDNTLVKEDSKSKEVNEKNNEQNNIEEVSKKENKLPNTGSPIGAEAMSQIGMLLLGAGVILKKKNKK
ncbi:LPXTG cell wall anchor domain-containing protein [Clostridium perfringens]|uniref:LPXTG cell wall anchor domain-containing protein n=1 Tax=Clostridium perfringens TaxID=1502 RepID=UPI002A220988|nr:LPXTG cell wall anchor domain-containing protein [Clostridium perfringens]